MTERRKYVVVSLSLLLLLIFPSNFCLPLRASQFCHIELVECWSKGGVAACPGIWRDEQCVPPSAYNMPPSLRWKCSLHCANPPFSAGEWAPQGVAPGAESSPGMNKSTPRVNGKAGTKKNFLDHPSRNMTDTGDIWPQLKCRENQILLESICNIISAEAEYQGIWSTYLRAILSQ